MSGRIASEAVMSALKARNADALAELIREDPATVNATGPGGESLILLACYMGAESLVPALQVGRMLDAAEAAVLGDIPALAAALARNAAALSTHTPDGWTPLHLACFFGREDAVQTLIDAGATLDVLSTNSTKNTPLHAALAGTCVPSLVKRLILAGAPVSALGEQDITPLHIAASRGNTALCDLLMSRGANPHATMVDGTTPAQLAAARGFQELAERLISA